MFEKFIKYKSKGVVPRSLEKYNNFRNRAWEPILNHLNIKYRKPDITRHTFISHALDRGMNPVDVAAMTGHDVQTLYENYAGSVSSRLRLPEL